MFNDESDLGRGSLEIASQAMRDLAPLPPTLVPGEILDRWLSNSVIEEFLERESVDSAWASRMEARILSELSTIDIDFIGIQAHCRTTMCRIEVIIDDRSRVLQHGVTSDTVMPAVRAAMRSNYERWLVPTVASWTMPYESGASHDEPGLPPRTRVWIAYVYDGMLLTTITPEGSRETERESIRSLLDTRLEGR
jgi:hypothetical protein